jgi:hypothetical protein
MRCFTALATPCSPGLQFVIVTRESRQERRKAIAKSIRTISVEELKKLAGELFRYADDPWRETFFRFIAENPGANFSSRGCLEGDCLRKVELHFGARGNR